MFLRVMLIRKTQWIYLISAIKFHSKPVGGHIEFISSADNVEKTKTKLAGHLAGITVANTSENWKKHMVNV